GNAQSLSLTYVGAIGRGLLRVTQLVNVNADFPSISYTTGSATSDYHALQLKFQRRLSRGLNGQASYSLAHSIDSSSTDAFATNLNTPGWLANPNIDRGSSDFDIRNAFSSGLTCDLPAWRSNKIVQAALSGWSLDVFMLARSAPPVNVVGARVNLVGL